MTSNMEYNYFDNICTVNDLFFLVEKYICENNNAFSGVEWKLNLTSLFQEDNARLKSELYFHIIETIQRILPSYNIYLFFDGGCSNSKLGKFKISKGTKKEYNLHNIPNSDNIVDFIFEKENYLCSFGFLDITKMTIQDIYPFLVSGIDNDNFIWHRSLVVLPKNIENNFVFQKWFDSIKIDYIFRSRNFLIPYALRYNGISVDEKASTHCDDDFYSFISCGNTEVIKNLYLKIKKT